MIQSPTTIFTARTIPFRRRRLPWTLADLGIVLVDLFTLNLERTFSQWIYSLLLVVL